MPEGAGHLLFFQLDDLRLALPLSSVEYVVRMVFVTPLSGSPDIVMGAINVRGAVLPVIDLRARLRLVTKELQADDRLVIAHTPCRTVAIVASDVLGVMDVQPDQVIDPASIDGRLTGLAGVVALPDGILLISDLATLLSDDEERALDRALDSTTGVAVP